MSRLTRDEGMLILERRGPVLDIAREVSAILRARGIEGAVIGGVAVVLHGHLRTTVDVLIADDDESFADALRSEGFRFDSRRLTGDFAARLDRPLRTGFRRLVRAIEREAGR